MQWNVYFVTNTTLVLPYRIQKAQPRILVEISSFLRCSTSAQFGGALYMLNGESIITKVCGVECKITPVTANTGWGQFSYISVSPDKLNDLRESSIALCGSEHSHTQSVRLDNGIVYGNRVNLSHNTCSYESSIACAIDSLDSHRFALTLQYCNVHNNTANNFRVIQFDCPDLKTNITFSNIIKNKQLKQGDTSGNGIINNYVGEMEISNCCFT